jgi:hypothetical protein
MTDPRLFVFDTFGVVCQATDWSYQWVQNYLSFIQRMETQTLKVFNMNSPARSSG